MTRGERPMNLRGVRLNTPETPKKPASERLRALWPDIWALIRPRRRILSLGLLLIVINKACSLVLPLSTKVLFDRVILHHEAGLLLKLTLVVVGATAVQGVHVFFADSNFCRPKGRS